MPMDVVLGRERTQRSQVLKQADVVALLALLPDAFDRRSPSDQLPLLRAALRARQLAQPRHARRRRGASRADRSGARSFP